MTKKHPKITKTKEKIEEIKKKENKKKNQLKY